MINPFISNNDSNYLFRKNYQFIPKPQTQSPPPSFSTSKLNFLQSRNPFTPPAPPIVSSPLPARSLSNSRAVIGSSSRDKLLLGKSRLLDDADGWKRQLETQQRGKLQAYGAEGLRYNAYSTYTPNIYESRHTEADRHTGRFQPNSMQPEAQFNDYYSSYTKPIEIKSPKNTKDRDYHSNFQLKSQRKDPPSPQSPYSKKVKEHFSDEINQEQEQSRNQGPGKKQRNKYELDVHPIPQESQRHSKLMDMFGSEMMDDRFKQSMHHNSYASYYADDLMESKQSKFGKESRPKHYLYESDVNRFEASGPPTITLLGKVYYKMEI